MPLELPTGRPVILIRKAAFERSGITRAGIDDRLGLTDQEFRVEGNLIVVGPVLDEDGLQRLVDDFENAGLSYFEDFFDFSGNWPEWLVLYGKAAGET